MDNILETRCSSDDHIQNHLIIEECIAYEYDNLLADDFAPPQRLSTTIALKVLIYNHLFSYELTSANLFQGQYLNDRIISDTAKTTSVNNRDCKMCPLSSLWISYVIITDKNKIIIKFIKFIFFNIFKSRVWALFKFYFCPACLS